MGFSIVFSGFSPLPLRDENQCDTIIITVMAFFKMTHPGYEKWQKTELRVGRGGVNTVMDKALRTMLDNWEKMKRSEEDEAEEDANQFEASFYALMQEVRNWVDGLEQPPKTLEEAMQLEKIEELVEQLPVEIMLNFETELELIVDGEVREEDERYD